LRRGGNLDGLRAPMLRCRLSFSGGAVAQLGARLDGIEEVVGSNPIGSTNFFFSFQSDSKNFNGH
jgi:hypothetical protein